MAKWVSPRDIIRRARAAATEEELKAVLKESAGSWKKLARNLLVLVLVGEGSFEGRAGSIRKWGYSLHAAMALLEECGYATDAWHVAAVVEHMKIVDESAKKARGRMQKMHLTVDKAHMMEQPLKVTLLDFDLALAHWGQLPAGVKDWFAFRFLAYWRSRDGFAALGGADAAGLAGHLARYRRIWTTGTEALAAGDKIQVEHALGLGKAFRTLQTEGLTSYAEYAGFLERFVDLTGSIPAGLVDDIKAAFDGSKEQSEQIKQAAKDAAAPLADAALLSRHLGLICGFVQHEPTWVVENILNGDVRVPETAAAPQPTVVRMLLRAMADYLKMSAAHKCGTVQLSLNQVKVVRGFLLSDEIRKSARQSNMMYQAREALCGLCARVILDTKGGDAALATAVMGYYMKEEPDARFSQTAEVMSERGAVDAGRARPTQHVASLPAVLEFFVDAAEGTHLLCLKLWLQYFDAFDPAAAAPLLGDAVRGKVKAFVARAVEASNLSVHTARAFFDSKWFVLHKPPADSHSQAPPLSLIYTDEERVELWRHAVLNVMDSWAFFTATAGVVLRQANLVPEAYGARRAYYQDHVYRISRELLERTPTGAAAGPPKRARVGTPASDCGHAAGAREEVLHVIQARTRPQEYVETYGVEAWLDLQGRVSDAALTSVYEARCIARGDVGQRTRSFPQTTAGLNDCLDPVAVFTKSVATIHKDMAKKKTPDDQRTLQGWVCGPGDTGLHDDVLVDPVASAQLEKLLVASWSNKEVQAAICQRYVDRVLAFDAVPLDRVARFAQQCPYLGEGRVRFLTGRLAGTKTSLARCVPLIETFAETAEDVVAFIESVGAEVIEEPAVEALFWKRLSEAPRIPDKTPGAPAPTEGGASRSPYAQVQLVRDILNKGWSFRAWRAASTLDADGPEGYEFWSSIDHIASGGSAAEAAADPAAPLHAALGPKGAGVVREYLSSRPPPREVAELLQAGTPFTQMCWEVAQELWSPPALGTMTQDDAKALLALGTGPLKQKWREITTIMWSWIDFKLAEQDVQARAAMMEKARSVMEAMLAGQVPNDALLDFLPRAWWHCLPLAKLADEAPAVRLVAAGVPLSPDILAGMARFSEFSASGQTALVDALGDDVQALAAHAPRISGPVLPYLKKLFTLLDARLAAKDPGLKKLGEGADEKEQLASGWNACVNALLCALRTRVTANQAENLTPKGGLVVASVPNFLHGEEQVVLFEYCRADLLNSGNANLLAQFADAKFVDDKHSARAVSYILSQPAYDLPSHSVVRDSALRAMVRLPAADRDGVIEQLLGGGRKLPLYALFTVCVSQLTTDALADGVLQQLDLLSDLDWEILVNYMRDANPARDRLVHTYPKHARVQARFVAVYFKRFLRGDNDTYMNGPHSLVHDPKNPQTKKKVAWSRVAKRRDTRFFLLFLAVCPGDEAAAYMLDALERQLYPFQDAGARALFLNALAAALDTQYPDLNGQEDPRRAAVFHRILDHLGDAALSNAGVRDWLCARVRGGSLPAQTDASPALLKVYMNHTVAAGAAGKRDVGFALLHALVGWGPGKGATRWSVYQDRQGFACAFNTARAPCPPFVAGEILRAPVAADAVWGLLVKERAAMVDEAVLTPAHRRAVALAYLSYTWQHASLGRSAPFDDAESKKVQRLRREQIEQVLPEVLADGEARRPAKAPLSPADVALLGVDRPARELLLTLAPDIALGSRTGVVRGLLTDAPDFTNALNDVEFNMFQQTFYSAKAVQAARKERGAMAALRNVAWAMAPASRALPVAVTLLAGSADGKEIDQDFELLKKAYLASDPAARRSTCLSSLLSGTAAWKKKAHAIQTDIIDAAAAAGNALTQADLSGYEAGDLCLVGGGDLAQWGLMGQELLPPPA
eukprot:TRINITY_DN5968_c0_g2_i1.p1 TRINITY_DN5968_c0_g2~~TRINITY_DN5968_c0_g2_i1.p1  ORF type:complete len:1882 (+),score=544.01 TRINITY_DN5968_c0_g2_i1:46-5691(+)